MIDRIVFNGGMDVDLKGKERFTYEESLLMEAMLQEKIKELGKELEIKFNIKVLFVDMPYVENVEVED